MTFTHLLNRCSFTFPRFIDFPIRYKLLLGYSLVFFLVIGLGNYVVNSFIRATIEENIESELKNSTSAITDLVRTSASVSIKNYFRGIAEKNLDIIHHFHQRYLRGEMTLDEATNRVREIILSQKIGQSGYIFVANSQGYALMHPKKEVEGENFSEFDFVKVIVSQKNGYIEYDWKNPGDTEDRPKALYMTYFEQWDWIICVSAYREEFTDLVNVDDFRDSILSFKFGKTGYSYVFNTKGEQVVHPKLQTDRSYIDTEDLQGRRFVRHMLEEKNGKMIYFWQNPDEKEPREKLVIFRSIPEFNWIVASSSYQSEIYAPLRTTQNIILATVASSLVLITFLTFWVSSLITKPLGKLTDQFAQGIKQDFSVRMKIKSKDGTGRLASYFNLFMEKLEEYRNNIQKEVSERVQQEKALRFSEEMFSKAFRSSPNGIFIASLKDLKFINVNDSFIRYLGYRRDEIIDKTIQEISFLKNKFEFQLFAEKISETGSIYDHELEYCNKSGERRIGVISAEIVTLWDEPTIFATIEDITERRQLERDVMEISEKERQQIGQNLHDDLCPHLIGIEVLTKLLASKIEKQAPAEADSAKKIKKLMGDAIVKTRSLARGLCPVHMVANGLEKSLQELVRSINDIYPVHCVFECDAPVLIHDSVVAAHLFYITQEAVQNAIKHGQADTITVALSTTDDKLQLAIVDNGVGVSNLKPIKGIGLKIMKYRANMIGASFEVGATKVGGTRVSVSQ
ncbi:cache domain-containing protein [bacterium]|nr:cache domain-containing protein [bacterium]